MFVAHKYSLSKEASIFSGDSVVQDFGDLNNVVGSTVNNQQTQKMKKKRSLSGNAGPDAEVIALSPKTLLATNRFICEVCNKGFQRDQNLQLHRRGHNLPWKLKQRNSKEAMKKRVYVCPEPSCVHHHPSRALGDLTGVKKHYSRKHGEKKWKCHKCSKTYAVQSDWKAHSKICGTREYRCDCGNLFSRKDSFVSHRAFCDALAEETARLLSSNITPTTKPLVLNNNISLSHWLTPNLNPNPNPNPNVNPNSTPIITQHNQNPLHHHHIIKLEPYNLQTHNHMTVPTSLMMTSNLREMYSSLQPPTSSSPTLSATALLQKATVKEFEDVDRAIISRPGSSEQGSLCGFRATSQKSDRLTRDFLGITGNEHGVGSSPIGSNNAKDMLTYAGGSDLPLPYDNTNPTSFIVGFPEPEWAWNGC